MADMALVLPNTNLPTDDHGGNLAEAKMLFPDAPEPWIDLSTGINPHSYPLFELPAKILCRLPERDQLGSLKLAAADYYGVDDSSNIVCAAGTHVLMQLAAGLVPPGHARIYGPTYSEHSRCAVLTGHQVETVKDLSELASADLAVVVNPNNPDGYLHGRNELLELANAISAHGGLLIVDEAFMDVAPDGHSLADAADNVVVLKSFGKFFGLAGVRLGFAMAGEKIVNHLSAALGPWPVSGPALAYGLHALADKSWQAAMRQRLAEESRRIKNLLAEKTLNIIGGTAVFTLIEHPDAIGLFHHLGEAGVLVRRFKDRQSLLRIGLPASEAEWSRLEQALRAYSDKVSR